MNVDHVPAWRLWVLAAWHVVAAAVRRSRVGYWACRGYETPADAWRAFAREDRIP